MPEPTLPDPMTVTIADLRAAIDRGEVTVRALTQACLDRIAALDRQGPALNAVLETNPDALAIAAALDAELAGGTTRGPLHGIPVMLKDNIATADGMENTAGSLAMLGATPTRDAFIVERLRQAGALILGKTNLSEWANFRNPVSASGWSGRGGQTRNPHQLDRNPSGSSSGSAVAVAAGYVPVAIGTETNGSIVSPANANGIVGIKPTVGLTSRMGVIPISHHQDTIGPMARTVADAAVALTAMAAPDPDDPAVRGQGEVPEDAPSYPRRPFGVDGIDYASGDILNTDGLRGARIGVWRPQQALAHVTAEVFAAALATLRDAGAELVDPVVPGDPGSFRDDKDEVEVLVWEIAPGVASYIERYVDPGFPIRTLADVVAFNNAHAGDELPWFGQAFLERSLAKGGDLADPDYLATVARTQRRGREEGIDAVLAEHRLDAIVAVSGAPATRIDLVNGDHVMGGSATPSATAGYPIVTVPAGNCHGLPVNVSFIGGAFSEPALIRLAYAFEQATRARVVPAFAPPGIEPPRR